MSALRDALSALLLDVRQKMGGDIINVRDVSHWVDECEKALAAGASEDDVADFASELIANLTRITASAYGSYGDWCPLDSYDITVRPVWDALKEMEK